MKKSLSLVLVLSVLSAMGYAQTNLDKEVDTEINSMYSNGKAPTPAAQAQSSGQPIYILNQATPTATSSSNSGAAADAGAGAAAVQKQPITVIEASPLLESRAEALRKARQDAETSTEAKIVEKLEASRLEDERRRANALFGDRMQGQVPEQKPELVQPQLGGHPHPAPAPAQQLQPQIYIIPQQAPVAPAKEEVKPTVEAKVVEGNNNEVTIIEKTDKTDKEVKHAEKMENEMAMNMPLEPTSRRYFTGTVGLLTVPDAENYVQGNYALGFTLGNKYDDTYAVEGSFVYANSEVRNVNGYYGGYYDKFDVNSYSGAIAMKWYMLKGMVKPILGALTQYTYRDFKWSDKNFGPAVNVGNSNSHAIDVGGIVGVEVEFSPKMTLGLDVRYLKNLVVRRNYSTDNYSANPYSNAYGYRTPIEDLDYYTISMSARVSF